MASDDADFWTLREEYRTRSTYHEEYLKVLDELENQIDFSSVKSCISFGTGSGEQEIEFVRRFLPNLRDFTVVDSDRESLKVFQGHIKDGRLLPGVATNVVEATVQDWNGTETSVDAVLLFNILIHIEPADRQVLIQKLKQCLNPGGIAVVIVGNYPVNSSTSRRQVGQSAKLEDSMMYSEVEKHLLGSGFSLHLTRDIKDKVDLSNLTDNLIKFIRHYTDSNVSDQQLRATIAESKQTTFNNPRKLAVFKN